MRVKSYERNTFPEINKHFYVKDFDVHPAEQYIAEGTKIQHRNHLGIRDCKEIFDMLKEGMSIYEIAKKIGRNVKTIKRLIKACETKETKSMDYKRCSKCGKPLEFIGVLDLNNKKINIRLYNLKKNLGYNAKKEQNMQRFETSEKNIMRSDEKIEIVKI